MSQGQKSSSYLYLRVTAGPHKGEVFRLSLRSRSIIGRDESCDVCLNKDGRISRKHAKVIFSKKNTYIKNISEKNKLTINEQLSSEAQLQNTDVVRLGATEFKIVYKEASKKKKSSSKSSFLGSANHSPALKVKKSKINPVSITIILLICFLGYQLIQPSDQDRESQRQVSSTGTGTTRALNPSVPQKAPHNVHAQAQYVKGFRDFKKGQYESGLLHFQRCLTVQPQHVLCRRYLGLSRKKIQELIQYHVVLGRKYKDQKQYQACSAAFRNVTFMIKDPSQKLFQEATKNYKFCENMLEGKF